MKILVVDDDLELLGLIGYALRQAGYLVVEATDGAAALEVAAREQPALVVLDVNLPRLDGFEVCRRLRERSPVPVLMLTVRGAEEDMVKALDLGADDYLAKPFSPRVLTARVRALLRRAGGEKPAPIEVGAFRLDTEAQMVSVDGGPAVHLTHLEFRLLQLLLANAGVPLPAERLLRHVWGVRGEGDRQLLKQLVRRLRQKIEVDPGAPAYLKAVSGVGYSLETGGAES